MKKLIGIALVAYGLGAFGVGIARASSTWDSMGFSGVVSDAMTHAAIWPSMLVKAVL